MQWSKNAILVKAAGQEVTARSTDEALIIRYASWNLLEKINR